MKSSLAPVFTLPAWRQRIVGRSGSVASTLARSSTSMAPWSSVSTPTSDAVPEPEQPQRPVDGGVPLEARDDPDPRCPDEPVGLDVVAGLLQHPVAPAGDADGVGGLRAGDETDGRAARKAQQILDPAARGTLGRFGGRRHQRVEGVLVPADGQHVGGRGGRRRATDHEAEVARPDRADQVAVGCLEQLVQHLPRWCRAVRQPSAEGLPGVLARRRTGDGSVGRVPPVPGRRPSGPDVELLQVHQASTRWPTRWVVVNKAE